MQTRSFGSLPPELKFAVGYVYSSSMKAHRNLLDTDHVESPVRIDRIYRALERHGLISRMTRIPGRFVSKEEILLVHTGDLWDKVEDLPLLTMEDIQADEDYYDSLSLYVCPGTFAAARYSCGSVIEAALSVARRDVGRSFAIVRPPGHHAEPDEHMGFRFFNNVAVAAKVVLQRTSVKRILIVDWDIHHGNGIQLAFNSDPSVLYISLHRYEDGTFYPCGQLGSCDSCGVGAGRGYSVNIPWSEAGMGDAEYLLAFDQVIMPIATEFKPEMVIVSAGFDSAEGDELGECNVTPMGYARMTKMLCSLGCGVVVALEGGYNLNSLSKSAVAVVQALLDDAMPHMISSPPAARMNLNDSAADVLVQVMLEQSKYWDSLSFIGKHITIKLLAGLKKETRVAYMRYMWRTFLDRNGGL